MIDILGLAARFVTYAGILCIVGAVAFRLLVLKRARLSTLIVARASRRAARVGAIACAGMLVSLVCKLALQTAEMRFPSDPWLGVAGRMLLDTSWGTTWIVQCGCVLLLAMSFSLAQKDALPRWNTLAVLSVVLAATPAFASHAMSAQRFARVTVVTDVLHVLGGSLWLGTLALMTLSVLGGDAIEPESEFSAFELRARYLVSLLGAFSPVALAGAAIVIATGILSSLAHVAHWRDLVGTAYGQALLRKVVSVGVVLLFGWRNWKFMTPRLVADGPRRMTRSMVAETVVTGAVLLLTAWLVVTPPPGESLMP